MKLIIHRGTREIGGTCVELSSENTAILLDFGLPISFEIGDEIESVLPEPIYTDIVSGTKKIDGLLLSHAHLDHYGLVGMLPEDIRVFMGSASSELIRFTDKFTPHEIGRVNTLSFQDRVTFNIGNFKITPYLMDHSAFDSYSFLVEDESKSIFYTGDLRGHGLKMNLFEDLISNPPKVDMLLMEGTIIGERESEPSPPEADMEKRMVKICQETKGSVFVTLASQNLDRIISFSRAAKKSGRKFIIDLYSAELFNRLQKFSGEIPQTDWPEVYLWYPFIQREILHKNGLGWVMRKHRKWKQRLSEFASEVPQSVMILRPGFRGEIKKLVDLSDSVWVYSMWRGYLDRSEGFKRLKLWTEKNKIPFVFLHTSGHAKLNDLRRLSEALSPEKLIPFHSFHADHFEKYFRNVRVVKEGELIEV